MAIAHSEVGLLLDKMGVGKGQVGMGRLGEVRKPTEASLGNLHGKTLQGEGA